MMSRTVFILNGPNLNLLGKREPAIYGTVALDDIAARCRSHAAALKIEIDFRQTNHEGVLVDWVQEAADSAGLILNAGAYTHTSIALHDALKALPIPSIEVHLSNIYAREAFRAHSAIAPAMHGSIAGFGMTGYVLALDAIDELTAIND